jgi:uncharacterized protein YndB with AHSA1/START domain
MTTTDELTTTTTQVHRVYITATPEAIWTAITDPDWTHRYGYGGYAHYDLKPGGQLRILPDDAMRAGAQQMGFDLPEVIIDGEVIEADPPNRLVTTWRMLMDPDIAAEGFTRLTYEIKQLEGYCSLTVIHDVTGAPKLAALTLGDSVDPGADGGGGHPWILSDLKSLLETGKRMGG